MKLKPLELTLITLFVVFAVVTGWLLITDISRETARKKEANSSQTPVLTGPSATEKASGSTRKRSQNTDNLDPLLARANERLVQFDNDEDYQRFLNSIDSSNLRLLGSLDSLRAAWLGFDNLSDFDGLLDPDELGHNYLVTLPLFPGQGQVQAGAVGFGGNALEWLGITGDNSQWGRDVVVAVVDTGITPHQALPENIQQIDLVAETGTSEQHGHGTAVASLIAGTNSLTPGVSPAATLLDIRVADSNGESNSFMLAQGITAAVDNGADVINISLGTYGNSLLVERAVQYADANGAVIIASSGNEGFEQPAFPAGYNEVYAVGAVDREGTLVDFSNTGDTLDITAPGLEVFAAWTDGRYIEFTGTSASAPYVAAAVATAMSEFQLTASQAAEYVLSFANEAGSAGTDPSYGEGLLDVGRVINSTTPNIYDIAAVSNLVETGESNSLVTIVQNQGTETISQGEVSISTPFAEVPLRLSNLAPGEIQTFEVPTSLPQNGEEFFVTTEATLSGDLQDADPENNIRSTAFDFTTEP